MLLHINPTRQRGKRTGSLAGASGWYMTFFAAGVICRGRFDHIMVAARSEIRTFSHPDHHLAEVAAALHVLERRDGVRELEDAVDHGVQLVDPDRLIHRLEHGPRADQDALNSDALHENRHRIDLSQARENADQGDVTTQADRAQ